MADNKLGKEIGRVAHFFDKIGVCVVELSSGLKVGDKVRVKGNATDFEQEIKSMQVEHVNVEKAKKGDSIGLKVKDKVRQNDKVYLVK
jgi:U32 family peptidase